MGWVILALCVVAMAGAGPLAYRVASQRGWRSPRAIAASAMIGTVVVLVVVLSFLGSVFEHG